MYLRNTYNLQHNKYFEYIFRFSEIYSHGFCFDLYYIFDVLMFYSGGKIVSLSSTTAKYTFSTKKRETFPKVNQILVEIVKSIIQTSSMQIWNGSMLDFIFNINLLNFITFPILICLKVWRRTHKIFKLISFVYIVL